MAAMVSVSPPAHAASRTASHGSAGAAASMANAAGTDSWVARLVPTSPAPWSRPSLAGLPAVSPVAQVIRAATSAAATQRPSPAARRAAVTAAPTASGTVAPATPALTAAATAAAPASATPVLCVTRLAVTTRRRSRSRYPAGGVAAHGRAVGRAVAAGLRERGPGEQRGQRPLRGRAEQAERAASPHVLFPGQQLAGQALPLAH